MGIKVSNRSCLDLSERICEPGLYLGLVLRCCSIQTHPTQMSRSPVHPLNPAALGVQNLVLPQS